MKYRVVGRLAEVGRDIKLYLSKEQLAARRGQVEKDDKFYRAISVLQFKQGEEINIASKADDLPASLMSQLEAIGGRGKTPKKQKTKVS